MILNWIPADIGNEYITAYGTAYSTTQAAHTHDHNYIYTIPYLNATVADTAADNHEHAYCTYDLNANDTYRITTDNIDVSTISAKILSQGIYELCYKDEYKSHKKIPLPSRDELIEFLTNE